MPNKIALDARICIIGAGPAGLSHAHYLRKEGYTNVDLLEKNGINTSNPDFKDHLEEVKSFLNQKRKILGIITENYMDYFKLLPHLDAQERDLVDVVEEYNHFINKNILWVKSGSSFNRDEFRNSLIAIKSIFEL